MPWNTGKPDADQTALISQACIPRFCGILDVLVSDQENLRFQTLVLTSIDVLDLGTCETPSESAVTSSPPPLLSSSTIISTCDMGGRT
mmetsp:Transcript_7540/g.16039  ORF Transcript_7540/g.16039 Transcript_7540/m.16039 type:complete len:88 (-) Transcript_7540:133-396(-)